MEKKILGVCGFLLFGTFGMLSGVAQIHDDEPDASSETIALQGNGLQRQEMSPEEKERRREECVRMYEYCFDACGKRYPKPNQTSERGKCRQECSAKNTECMKKIESNPTEKPDW